MSLSNTTEMMGADCAQCRNVVMIPTSIWNGEDEIRCADHLEVGDRVAAGEGDDHDHGFIVSIDGENATVAWDTEVRTTAALADLTTERDDCASCATGA